ncbi:MAG: hypothetical protein QM706_14765 [Nitrospira sp.]
MAWLHRLEVASLRERLGSDVDSKMFDGSGFGRVGTALRDRQQKVSELFGCCHGEAVIERTTMSVWVPSGSVNFTAIPRGISSLSDTVGNPDPAENRTVAGIGFLCG